MTAPIFQMGVDARLIFQSITKASVGQQFTYAELSAITSSTVTSSSGCLRTAMLRALRDKSMVFGCIYKVGIKRLADTEIVDEGTAHTDRIRRATRRSIERLTKVNFETLPREKQAQHSARLSIMATIGHMTKQSQFQKLEDAAAKAGRELPIAATLAMFAPAA